MMCWVRTTYTHMKQMHFKGEVGTFINCLECKVGILLISMLAHAAGPATFAIAPESQP